VFSAGILVAALSGHAALAAPSDRSASTLPAVSIDNFGQVDAKYYRGAQPVGADYEALKTLGVKTVINLTSDDADPAEPGLAAKAGLRYVAIPMTTHVAPTDAQLRQFFDVVNDPASQPVYVHCVGGKHRTGVMTAVYRMTAGGWTPDRAFSEMKQYKFGADFLHSEFKAFVYSYKPAVSKVDMAAATMSPREHASDATRLLEASVVATAPSAGR
jgi:protein tyrosine/serine phosphatase